MNAKHIIKISLLPSFAALVVPPPVSADHMREPHWTYKEQKRWGLLGEPTYSPHYPFAECGIGQKQSPVNIDMGNTHTTEDIDEIEPDYPANPLNLSNNGHTIRVNTATGRLRIGKSVYDLLQYHFHAPSEHHLNGVEYPLEIHFVNGSEDGRVAVIGVFIQTGDFNEEFQKILDASPHKEGGSVNLPLLLDPRRFLPTSLKHFYSYAGSLTTPPCTEGIQWYLLGEPIQASAQQIEEFNRRYYHGNVRGEQKLNGRHLLAH